MFNHCWALDWRTIIFMSFLAGLIPIITPIITETIFQDIIPILDRKGLATVTQVSAVALSTAFFRKFQSGEIASRFMGMESVVNAVSGDIVSQVFNFVFSSNCAGIKDPQIGAISVVPVEKDTIGVTPVIVYSTMTTRLIRRRLKFPTAMTATLTSILSASRHL